MNIRLPAHTLARLSAVSILAISAHAQERELGVRQPPDAVFDVPLEDVMPRLTGASATGENGRVGGELVFWGYRLADGTPAYFFACAMLYGVNCEERASAICPTRTIVLERGEHTGEAVQRRCRDVAVAAPGDVHPGCTSNAYEASLAVGLVTCE